MDNLSYYEQFRKVPDEAKKLIGGGRLKGKTDINPKWRIKKLTEMYGPCGLGWYPEIVRTWVEPGVNNEHTANVEIKLYVKFDNEWSKGIPGIGGSMFVAKEGSELYVDDDCYKKAYTDAISVACKALGIAADVYFEKDPDSKYGEKGEDDDGTKLAKLKQERIAQIKAITKETKMPNDKLAEYKATYGIEKIEEAVPVIYNKLIEALQVWKS